MSFCKWIASFLPLLSYYSPHTTGPARSLMAWGIFNLSTGIVLYSSRQRSCGENIFTLLLPTMAWMTELRVYEYLTVGVSLTTLRREYLIGVRSSWCYWYKHECYSCSVYLGTAMYLWASNPFFSTTQIERYWYWYGCRGFRPTPLNATLCHTGEPLSSRHVSSLISFSPANSHSSPWETCSLNVPTA